MNESQIWTPTSRTDSLLRDYLEATTTIRLKPFQCEMLHLIETRQTQAFAASRQVGKTFGLAGAAYSFGIINPGSLILIVSTGEKHAKEILDRVRDCFNSIISEAFRFTFTRDSADELRLRGNGSRIVSLPSNPNTARGYSPDLILIDEVAAIQDWEEMQASLFPSVSQTNGSIVLTSTFKGKNHFWDICNNPEWNAKIYPWYVNPSPVIEKMRRILPREQFSEEYECIPVDEAWSLFPLDLLEHCSVERMEEWLA